jgi:hypothetical protein
MPEPDFRAALQQLADAVDGWELEPAADDPLAIAMDHARKVLQTAEDGERFSSGKPVNLAKLHDPDFSDGLTASQHLDVLRGGPDPRVAATASPGLPELEAMRILRLAEIIREVDGKHDLGAAALAEAILAHPGFSGCHDGPAAPPAQGVLNDRYEFSVIDSEDCEQAGGSALTLNDAIREGRNYLRQCNQDGPHRLELRRVLVLDCSEPTNA